jgi:hypothetical protein
MAYGLMDYNNYGLNFFAIHIFFWLLERLPNGASTRVTGGVHPAAHRAAERCRKVGLVDEHAVDTESQALLIIYYFNFLDIYYLFIVYLFVIILFVKHWYSFLFYSCNYQINLYFLAIYYLFIYYNLICSYLLIIFTLFFFLLHLLFNFRPWANLI